MELFPAGARGLSLVGVIGLTRVGAIVLTRVGARGSSRVGAKGLTLVGASGLSSVGAKVLARVGARARSLVGAARESSTNGKPSCTRDRITDRRSFYCARNAVSGLTALARRAGSQTAISETIVSTSGITMNTAGSRACTW
jgi:hypothetical protein